MTEPTEVAELLYALGKRNSRKGPLPILERNSPQWNAWHAWRKEHNEPVGYMDKVERFTVPSEWPPVTLEALRSEISSPSTRFKT